MPQLFLDFIISSILICSILRRDILMNYRAYFDAATAGADEGLHCSLSRGDIAARRALLAPRRYALALSRAFAAYPPIVTTFSPPPLIDATEC
jgi:hypothetical protein